MSTVVWEVVRRALRGHVRDGRGSVDRMRHRERFPGFLHASSLTGSRGAYRPLTPGTGAKDRRPGVVALALERVRLPRAVTVACMATVACLGLAWAAASARAEVKTPVTGATPITLPYQLEGELKVAGEATGGAALGVTAGAVVYTIIKNAGIEGPVKLQTPLLMGAVRQVVERTPELNRVAFKAIGPILTHLGDTDHELFSKVGLEDLKLKAVGRLATEEKGLIVALSVAANDPSLSAGEVDVVTKLRSNVKLISVELLQKNYGSAPPTDLPPPLPPSDLPPPPPFVKNPAAQAANDETQTITEIDEQNVQFAQIDHAYEEIFEEVNHKSDPSLPSVTSSTSQLVAYADNTPGLKELSADIGTSPQDPLKLTPSGGIETTVGQLDTLSAQADQQATAITKQTALNVKEEVAGKVTPQAVVADEESLGAELQSDSADAQLAGQALRDGTPGGGVSSSATGALGAAKIVASDAVDETTAVVEEGASNGAKAAEEAGEAASSLVDPLMLVQIATQLPQIITQIVQLIKGEPSFEQQVLSALGSIKEQISALSQQVQEGFNYVDETLRGVDTKIAQDTQLLEHVAANGSQLQSDLAEITGKLDQIQATLYRIAESAREENLNTALNTYIGYGRLGAELPVNEFAKAVGIFFTWGDESSLNAVSEHKGGSRGPNQVAAELQGSEGANALNENLDYLASFANHAGWLDGLPALNENVPNPEVWATASNAYSQLLVENRGDLSKGVASSLGELESVGQSLQPFIREISEKGPSYAPMEVDGVKIDTGSSIVNHALANYLRSAVAPGTDSGVEPSLVNRIQAQQNAILAAQPVPEESYGHCPGCKLAVAPTGERGNTGEALINPWASVNQTPSVQLPGLEATSDIRQKNGNTGGVSHLGEMNLCQAHVAVATNGAPEEASSLPAWLEFAGHHYSDPGGTAQQPDALLIGLGSYEGQEVLPENTDPLSAMFTNAWHLGFGRLIACYAPEFFKGGIKLQVIYMWEWPGHIYREREVLLRLTMYDPLPKAQGCFGNPVQAVHDLWNFEVENGLNKKHEGNTCWHEEVSGLNRNEIEPQLAKLTAFVKSHFSSLPEEKEQCKKETGDLFECEVEIQGGPDLLEPPGTTRLSGGSQEEAEGANRFQLSGEVWARLAQLRQELNKHVAEPNASESLNEEAPADVQQAAVRVNGARALLDDYIELGMPNAMTEDPLLRNFIVGVGDNLADAEKSGDHLLDNSPGSPNISSIFTRELEEIEPQFLKINEHGFGEIEPKGHPAILWPAAFPQEPCSEKCPTEVGLDERANPIAEQVIEEPKRSPKRKNEHDGIVPFAFKRSVELLARRLHTDLEPPGASTEATTAFSEEPIVEAATTQLQLTRELLSIPPVNSKSPDVSGTPVAGETLNCSPGSWEPQPSPTFTYVWLRNGASVGEGPSYVVSGGDVGQELACEVTATNREGEAGSATSAPVTALATVVHASTEASTEAALLSAVIVPGGQITKGLLPNPNLTIETTQKLKGSKAGFTTRELTVALGGAGVAAGRHKPSRGRAPRHYKAQIIEYQITVRNTGNVPLALTKFSDPYCARISSAGAIGEQLQPGHSARYSCEQTVSHDGTYLNQATIEATPPVGDGFMISRASNETVALGPNPEPTAETGGASEVTQNTALVAGEVNPHGRNVTICEFEYWTTAALHRATCAKSPGHGTKPVKVTARLDNLRPATTYHYGIVASNPTGTSRGNAQQFTTLAAPEAITQAATGVG
jgi:hypothetical protein